MNLFSRIAATAIAGVAVFGASSAVIAGHITQQPYVESETRTLLRAAVLTGHEVYAGGDMCDETEGLMGFATDRKQLVICAENHGDDLDELADTVRHEVLHLAQYCKARRLYGSGIVSLIPEMADEFISDAQEHLHWHILGYEEDTWATEAEARVLAYGLEEEQVAQILVNECSN